MYVVESIPFNGPVNRQLETVIRHTRDDQPPNCIGGLIWLKLEKRINVDHFTADG